MKSKQLEVSSNIDFNGYQARNMKVHNVALDTDVLIEAGVFSYSAQSNNLFIGNGATATNLSSSEVTNINSVQFNTSWSPSGHSEGLLFYDTVKKTLSYYNEEEDVTVNIGREMLIRVKNTTGSTILNGTVVYPMSGDGTYVLIDLANAKDLHKSRVVGVVTHDIENNSVGYVTKFGQLSDIDTSSYTAGTILYLDTIDGQITANTPTGGSYITIIGVVETVGVNGTIIVDTKSSDKTVESTNTNGFTEDQKAATTLSFVNGTRTFTISGTNYHYYQDGLKYEKVIGESLVITDVEGEHFIYYNGDVLSELVNPTPTQIRDIILNRCFICTVKWNAVDKKIEFDLFEERHGISMSPVTHLYLHRTRGAQHINGYGLSDFVIGNGSLNTHTQFSAAAGLFVDEDINHSFTGTVVGDTIDVAYILGSDSKFRTGTQTGYAYLNGTRLYYNQLNGVNWQLTEIANDTFMLYHIFGANGVNKRIISVMGQNQYNTKASARTGANTEIGNIRAGFTIAESVPVATIVYQSRSANVTGVVGTWSRVGTTITVVSNNHNLVTSEVINVTTIDGSQTTGNKTVTVVDDNTYTFVGVGSGNTNGTVTYTKNAFTNTNKCRIIDISSGVNYIDWRTTELAQGVNPTSHANLTNVLQAGLGVHDGHISNVAQTIYGIKTFDSLPESSVVPTTANQLVNKAYVDANSGGGASIWEEYVGAYTIDSTSQITITGVDKSALVGGSIKVISSGVTTKHYIKTATYSTNTVLTVTGTVLPATIDTLYFDNGLKTVAIDYQLWYGSLVTPTNGSSTYQQALQVNSNENHYNESVGHITGLFIKTVGSLGTNAGGCDINIYLSASLCTSNIELTSNTTNDCGVTVTYANSRITRGTLPKIYNNSSTQEYGAYHVVTLIITKD